MTTSALISLSIESLRGSVTPFTLAFEKGKKLTIVYGENGTGKSTISDAFDLLGNGKVGSLDNKGVGGATRTYWPSVGKMHADVKVALATSAGTCTLALNKSNIVLDNEHLKPRVAVLRRNEILKLISAQPADRYKEISRFVDVSGVESSEAALRKLILDKEKEYETAVTRVGASRWAIENFWAQAGSPTKDAISWAKMEVGKDQGDVEHRKGAIEGLISRWVNIVDYPKRREDLAGRVKAAESLLATAQETLKSITANAADGYLEILEILNAAKRHFATHPNPEVCPLCESADKVQGLVADVNRRIEAQGLHARLDGARRLVAAEDGAVQKAKQRLDDFMTAASAEMAALELYCAQSNNIAGLELPVFPAPKDAALWASWIDASGAKSASWKRAADECVDSRNFLETLRRSLSGLDGDEDIAKDLADIIPRLREVLEVVERERKKYTDGILGAISTRVGELYEVIHPGEGLNRIVLALDAAKRGSLDITMQFAGKRDTPPQAYFSDSHLDTLGLCAFLALAERDVAERRVLVLDDVLGSVDEPHVERVIGLIYDVSQKFQHAIVTTHYRPWREKFRWGILKPDQVCQFVELRNWSLGDGIALSGSIPEIKRLSALLKDPDPDIQAITGKAGVILEALLDFITLKYGCAVPRRPGGAYVMSDLLGAVNGKLLGTLTAELVSMDAAGSLAIEKVPIKPILDAINNIAQARNVLGAHFNTLSFDLNPEEGIRFARLVQQLSDALVCPDSGWPTKDTGSHWKNGQDTRRLHPLKKPS